MRHDSEIEGLPFIPFVLVALLVLAYFFGWMVFAYAVAVFLLITLGVWVYDRVTAAPEEGPDATHFWLVSQQDLLELWQPIAAGLQAQMDVHDHENVWEWMTARSGGGLMHWNISRKHQDYGYPVHIKVSLGGGELSSRRRDELGRQLAKALKTEIKSGPVIYLKGNEFEFKEERDYKYEA